VFTKGRQDFIKKMKTMLFDGQEQALVIALTIGSKPRIMYSDVRKHRAV
jgi:ABC-type phosphate transport system ATPase subunit